MRRFLFGILLLLGVIFVLTRLAEVKAIGNTVRHGDWRYLGAAFVLELLWIVNVAVIYWFIYRKIGLKERMDTLLLASSGAYFANVVAPTAGASGMAVLISTARKNGYSTARTTIAGILYLLFDYSGFIMVLCLGLVVLFRRDNLSVAEIIASSALILFALALGLVVLLASRSEEKLARLLVWFSCLIQQIARPFTKRVFFQEGRAREFAHEAATAITSARHRPGELTIPWALSMLGKLLLILILLLIFLAFGIPFSLGTLIAAFSIGYLFLIVSPTPAGIGTVEGALTLALSSMYIPLGAAMVVTLAYRGITFWIPLAFGGLALRILGNGRPVQISKQIAGD